MATSSKKIKDYFSSISNPSGGLSSLLSSYQNKAPASYLSSISPKVGLSSLLSGTTTKKNTTLPAIPDGPMSRIPVGPVASAAPTTAPVAPMVETPAAAAPVSRGTQAPAMASVGVVGQASQEQASQVPPNWLNADGTFKTPDQIAGEMGSALRATQGQGDIGTLAGGYFGGGEKTAEQLRAEATLINNTRNDIAVGESDPYGVASKSGIAYTPAELNAIEKAYAGIYDPAIATAFAKVEQKQIEDEVARKEAADIASDERNNAFDLEKMARQFEYDRALKQTPTPGSGTGSGSYSGTYVPGENPVVDAWAQRIFDGGAKITDIPASDKGLRNAVTIALQASGNDLAGRPTRTELGTRALEAAKQLREKMKERTGTSAVGGSRIFGGSLAVPGSEKANFVIDFQNLKDMLSLDGVRYLKGQGQVSDAERSILASAVTKLNLSQSDGEEGDFLATLDDIISTLDGSNPAFDSMNGSVQEDAGGLPVSMILNGQVLYLQPDGTYE